MPRDNWPPTLREATGSVVAILAVGAICWSALWDGSQAAQTALVGACGAVTGWLFRGPSGANANGTGDPVKPSATL